MQNIGLQPVRKTMEYKIFKQLLCLIEPWSWFLQTSIFLSLMFLFFSLSTLFRQSRHEAVSHSFCIKLSDLYSFCPNAIRCICCWHIWVQLSTVSRVIWCPLIVELGTYDYSVNVWYWHTGMFGKILGWSWVAVISKFQWTVPFILTSVGHCYSWKGSRRHCVQFLN